MKNRKSVYTPNENIMLPKVFYKKALIIVGAFLSKLIIFIE